MWLITTTAVKQLLLHNTERIQKRVMKKKLKLKCQINMFELFIE